MNLYLAVALGSALGGLLRFIISAVWFERLPWPTLLINVAGSILIGFIFTFTAAEGRFPLNTTWRAFLMPGFCGGFTTFSTFSAEALSLWKESGTKAAIYILSSVVLSLIGVWIGQSWGEKYN